VTIIGHPKGGETPAELAGLVQRNACVTDGAARVAVALTLEWAAGHLAGHYGHLHAASEFGYIAESVLEDRP